MPQVRFLNVKHGDFGIFEDNNYICILDCGTSQPNSYLKVYPCLTPKLVISHEVNRIKQNKPNCIIDVLISHYHEDHYNGLGLFKKFGIVFRHMYVPYIDFTASYTKEVLYAMCLMQATAEVLRIPFTLLRQYHKLFTENYAGRIFQVSRGNKIPFIKDSAGNVAEILWPPKNIYDKDSKTLKKFIKGLEKELRKYDLSKAIEIANKYFEELNEKLIKLIERKIITEWKETNEKELDELSIMNIDDLLSKDEDMNEKHCDDSVRNAFNRLKMAVRNYMNALSIVFRVGKSLVFMGDITEKVLQILSKDLAGDYIYIKLPHHGTESIHPLQNTRAKFFVISLSDGRHYRGKFYKPVHWSIISKARQNGTIILCTDGHKNCGGRYNRIYCYPHLEIHVYI